jgi:hypothetical protein
MKKAYRITVLLWTISLSIVLIAVIHANPSEYGSDAFLEPLQSQLLDEGIWAPQKVWLQIITNRTGINLYILDNNGIQLWKEQSTIAPMFSFENISQISYKFMVPARNTYAILAQNLNNSTTTISVNLTFYDFEADLLLLATSSFIIGIAITVAYSIKQWLTRKNGLLSSTELRHSV